MRDHQYKSILKLISNNPLRKSVRQSIQSLKICELNCWTEDVNNRNKSTSFPLEVFCLAVLLPEHRQPSPDVRG